MNQINPLDPLFPGQETGIISIYFRENDREESIQMQFDLFAEEDD